MLGFPRMATIILSQKKHQNLHLDQVFHKSSLSGFVWLEKEGKGQQNYISLFSYCQPCSISDRAAFCEEHFPFHLQEQHFSPCARLGPALCLPARLTATLAEQYLPEKRKSH